MTSVYRPILKIAWQIMWKAKYLWWLGLLAALIGPGNAINIVVDNFSTMSDVNTTLPKLKLLHEGGFLEGVAGRIKDLFVNLDVYSIILMIILLALFLFILWLAVASQVGLIQGGYKEYRKQPSDFVTAFRAGKQSFWPALLINILGKALIQGILFLVGLPLAFLYLYQSGEGWQTVFTILAFIILIPLAVIVSFIIRYALMFLVIKKEKVWLAIASAWKLFIKHWIVSLEMAILLFLVNLAFGIVMILSAIVLALPLSLLLYTFYVLKVGGVIFAGVIITLVLVAVLMFWLGALLSVYQSVAWVIIFDRLTESQVYSKLVRMVESWKMKRKGIEINNQ